MLEQKHALNLLLSGAYNAAIDILDINLYPLEYAYAVFLKGDFSQAKAVLAKNDSIRSRWLAELINLFETSQMLNVTYFEIRNFLELDIDLFIKSKKVNYAEKLFKYAPQLTDVNNETYKLIARVLFNNNLLSLAKNYFDIYKNIVYCDPELHFMYAKYYITYGDYKNALTAIEQCIAALPEYYPAIKLKQEIYDAVNRSDK